MKRLIAVSLILMVAAGAAFANGRNETAGTGEVRGTGWRAESTDTDGEVARGPGRGAGSGGRGSGVAGEGEYLGSVEAMLEEIELAELSEAEAEGIIFMREEEKLARDVYNALYEIWNYPVFTNIARSEQQHMDSILSLIDRYDLDDPVADDVPGVFESEALQSVYDELIALGSESLAGAFTVGATIEDLDMADLIAHIEETDNEDIALIYQNLFKGSRNHMRAFASQLDRLDVAYEAQYVSDEYLAAVLSSDNEALAITDASHEF